jgi:hypothetical protein
VVFYNSDDAVWRTIQDAAREAGFDLVNALAFDKVQRSFKGVRGEKGLEDVTNFDIVLNLQKRPDRVLSTLPVTIVREGYDKETQPDAETVVLNALRAHLTNGGVPQNHRTMQYLHSLAIRTLLNAGMKVEVNMPSLEILLQRHGFKQVDGKWYLQEEEVFTGQLLTERISDEASAITWLRMELSEPQTKGDLIPKWQRATLGVMLFKDLDTILKENFIHDDATGKWRVPTPQERKARQTSLSFKSD